MPKMTVLPGNTILEVEMGSNLRTSLMENGFNIKSTCGGCASCSQCVVVIKNGAESLSDISFEEKQLLGNVFHLTSERLSCQTTVNGDIVVDVSAHVEDSIKVKPKTHRRTRDEANQVLEDRKQKAKERPQKQGGLKRPKPFST